MTSILQNVYIEKSDDIDDKQSNIFHRTLKMKHIDIKSITYIDFDVENSAKGLEFKVGYHVRI